MSKRSVTISGHQTSIFIEDEFWNALKEMASDNKLKPVELIALIDSRRGNNNLSAAVRIAVLNYFRTKCENSKTDNLNNHKLLFGKVI